MSSNVSNATKSQRVQLNGAEIQRFNKICKKLLPKRAKINTKHWIAESRKIGPQQRNIFGYRCSKHADVFYAASGYSHRRIHDFKFHGPGKRIDVAVYDEFQKAYDDNELQNVTDDEDLRNDTDEKELQNVTDEEKELQNVTEDDKDGGVKLTWQSSELDLIASLVAIYFDNLYYALEKRKSISEDLIEKLHNVLHIQLKVFNSTTAISETGEHQLKANIESFILVLRKQNKKKYRDRVQVWLDVAESLASE